MNLFDDNARVFDFGVLPTGQEYYWPAIVATKFESFELTSLEI